MTDITLKNLETELIQASSAQPVLLDIWAPWCAPCRTLGPILERVEQSYAGRFKLAKLNSDDQPEIASQLSQAFGVKSIPFCVMFVAGQPVDGFVGALPESKIREFLDRHVPAESALQVEAELEAAEALEAVGDTDSALDRLQQAVAIDPANDTARFDYIKLLLETERTAQARAAFDPVASKTLSDRRLAALGAWLTALESLPTFRAPGVLAELISANRRDFEARFELAQSYLATGQFTQAMDELLEIVMRDKEWSHQLARKTFVAILELMTRPAPKAAAQPAKGTLELTGKSQVSTGDPVVDQYRRKLSMALN